MNRRKALLDMMVGLEAQGWNRSFDMAKRMCVYRNPLPDGTTQKCALGHILSDETVNRDLPDRVAGSTMQTLNITPGNTFFPTFAIEELAAKYGPVEVCDLEWLVQAQKLHDNAATAEGMFTAFADKLSTLPPSNS